MELSHRAVIVLALLFVVVVAAALLTGSWRIGNVGNIKTIGVSAYFDAACTENASFIDWGLLYPGESKNQTVYVKNDGNVNVTLSMVTENWSPVYHLINCTWNREGFILSNVTDAVLTLNTSPLIENITDFSFDIVIIGSEV